MGFARTLRRPEEFDPSDIDSLVKSVNSTSDNSRTNWLSMLALVGYLLVSTAGITHENLLLDQGVRLPLVNVQVGVAAFYISAPIAAAAVYFAVVLQHFSLLNKVRLLHSALSYQELLHSHRDEPFSDAHPARQNLSSYFCTQLAAGDVQNRMQVLGLQACFIFTLYLIPVISVLSVQISFLPFHDGDVTLLHQIVVTAVTGVSATAWFVAPMQLITSVALRYLAGATMALVLFFSWMVATVPDSTADRAASKIWPMQILISESQPHLFRTVFAPTAQLFESSRISETSRWRLIGALSRNLEISDMKSPIGQRDQGLGSAPARRLSLRGRNLRYARFDRSEIKDVDFSGADATGASFSEAKLMDVKFGCLPLDSLSIVGDREILQSSARRKLEASWCAPQLQIHTKQHVDVLLGPQRRVMKCAALPYTNFDQADLKSVSFRNADMRWTQMQAAQFDKVELSGANLCGATLSGPSGPNLSNSPMHDTVLIGADLYGATIIGGEIYNVDARLALFDTAIIAHSNLESTRFTLASFHEAVLFDLDLHGADFNSAHIGRGTAIGKWLLLRGSNTDVPQSSLFAGVFLHDAAVVNSLGDALKAFKSGYSSEYVEKLADKGKIAEKDRRENGSGLFREASSANGLLIDLLRGGEDQAKPDEIRRRFKAEVCGDLDAAFVEVNRALAIARRNRVVTKPNDDTDRDGASCSNIEPLCQRDRRLRDVLAPYRQLVGQDSKKYTELQARRTIVDLAHLLKVLRDVDCASGSVLAENIAQGLLPNLLKELEQAAAVGANQRLH